METSARLRSISLGCIDSRFAECAIACPLNLTGYAQKAQLFRENSNAAQCVAGLLSTQAGRPQVPEGCN